MDTTNLAMQPFTLAFKSAEVEGEFLGEVAKKRWPVLVFIFCFDVLCFLFRFTAKLSGTAGSPDGEAGCLLSSTNSCMHLVLPAQPVLAWASTDHSSSKDVVLECSSRERSCCRNSDRLGNTQPTARFTNNSHGSLSTHLTPSPLPLLLPVPGAAAVHPFDVVQEMGHQLANMAMLYVLIGLLNKRARKAGDNAARQVSNRLAQQQGVGGGGGEQGQTAARPSWLADAAEVE
jgi:hypothetical protein